MSGYVDRLLERIATRIAAQIAADGDSGRRLDEPDARDGAPGLAGPSGPAPSGSGNGSEPAMETPEAGGALRLPPPVVPIAPPPPPPAVAAPTPPPPPFRRAPETVDPLGDPRLAADLRRARLEPDAAARPYEEVRRELAIGDEGGVADRPVAVSLKVPAQEQLAAQPAQFRLSLHELLLRLGDEPFRAGAALAAGDDARRLLDDGGYWIVYKPLDGGERVVVEALRRRLRHTPATRREV